MLIRLPLIAVVSLALGGCASQIGAFFNRPVVQDRVEGAVSTFAQSADRRTVVVSVNERNYGKFCAEPPPDSATGLKTELQANLETQAQKLSLGDKLESSVVVLSSRTANLDAYRTGVYALCQFNLNGAISDSEVRDVLVHLSDNFVAVEKLSAGKNPVSPERAASGPK